MADEKTTKAFVIRDFTDAGTETSFTASKDEKDTVDIEDGAFANYERAGLVRAPETASAKPAPAA